MIRHAFGSLFERARILHDVGTAVTLRDCPPGPFLYEGGLCFKTEYGTQWPDAYCLESGEFFWGGTTRHEDRAALIVQPLECVPSPEFVHADLILHAWVCLTFAMATLIMVVSVYFITTTSPEQIGEWLGRIGHNFRGG